MNKPPRLEYTAERLSALRTAFGQLANAHIFTTWTRVWKGKNWTKMPIEPSGTPGVTFKCALERFNAKKSFAGIGVKLGPVPGTSIVVFGVDYDGAESTVSIRFHPAGIRLLAQSPFEAAEAV